MGRKGGKDVVSQFASLISDITNILGKCLRSLPSPHLKPQFCPLLFQVAALSTAQGSRVPKACGTNLGGKWALNLVWNIRASMTSSSTSNTLVAVNATIFHVVRRVSWVLGHVCSATGEKRVEGERLWLHASDKC